MGLGAGIQKGMKGFVQRREEARARREEARQRRTVVLHRQLCERRAAQAIARALRKKSPQHRKIRHNLTTRLWDILKRAGRSKTESIMALVGCDEPTLCAHLESLFQPGMTWENYGAVWHVDHRKPCASFDLTYRFEQQACFHFSNLQPLFALDNKRKGARFP